MDMKIRRTLFGGFNRHDVIVYIEELTAARDRETADLKRELERVTAERDAAKRLGGDTSALRSELDVTKQALSEMSAKASALEQKLVTTETLAEQRGARLSEYEQADMKLSDKLAELERVKARVTDIELEAHDRARRIEQDAREASTAARAEADRLIGDLRWRFDEARGTAGQSLNGAIREIDAMRAALERVLAGFDETGARLNKVSAKESDNGDAQN